MELGLNTKTYKWEMKPIQIKVSKRKVLPYAALKREYLELPITDKFELYVYSALSAYCEYCGGSFKGTIEYLSDYYAIAINDLKYWINELIDKNLIEIQRQDDGSYEFKTVSLD